MKQTSAFALVALLVVAPLAAQAQRGYGFDPDLERRVGSVYERALLLANAKMLSARLNVADKQVVISKRRGYIVVSFLGGKQDRGNRAHIVYDPVVDKVVFISSED